MNVFSPALLDPNLAIPEGLIDPEGRPAGARFDVYRNNIVVSLTEAMIAGFPIVLKLVGDDFFRATVGVFVRAHPPRSPILATYGTNFPVFLEGFPPVTHLPYLADVARLELAMRESYHAADARPIAPDALQDPHLMEAKVTLAPATRLVISAFPVHAIWAANTDPTAPPAHGGAEAVLILRPDYDPTPIRVPPAAAQFVAALLDGAVFGSALEAAGPELDLAATLTLLLDKKAITQIKAPT